MSKSAAASVLGLEKPEVLDQKSIDKALGILKLETGGDLAEKVERIQNYFKGQAGNKSAILAACDNCGLISDMNAMPFCAYCGETDTPPVAATPVLATPSGLTLTDKNKKKIHEAIVVTDLDQAIERIREARRGSIVAEWVVVETLAQISKKDLWKQRTTAEGKVAYKTFEAFTRAELGIGRKYAEDVLRMYSLFAKEDVEQLGTGKLSIIMRVQPEEHARLLEKAKKGASKREIEEEASSLPRQNKSKARKPKVAPPSADGRVTVAVVADKKHKVMLFADGPKGAPEKRAKRIGDIPCGTFDMSNDTRMIFKVIQNTAGEWDLVFQVKRIDPKS